MCCANCSFRDLILGWARLPLHLSHPVGHLGLCSLGELWVSLASSHFYVFCCLVEFKKNPMRWMSGFLKELGVASKQAGKHWPVEFGNAQFGQGRLQEAAGGAECCPSKI